MSASSGGPSTLTKMRQVYWEAKQSFNKSLGQLEDDFIDSSDNGLDTKIELLQVADTSFNVLMRVILNYGKALQNLVDSEEKFGLALIEYGKKDLTAAGKILCMSGRVIKKAAQRQIQFKANLTILFHVVQTFQFKATADALKTVSKMEKTRKSYRSGLMWLKNESMAIDPDISKKLRKFRKIQEHIKHLKIKFDGVKLESMQKIDLFLLSRINLFSNTLVPYNKAFRKICNHIVNSMDRIITHIPLCLSFNFVALKELNEYSKNMLGALQKEQFSEQIPQEGKKTNPKCYSISNESTNYAVKEYSFSSKDAKNDTKKLEDIKNNDVNSSQANSSAEDSLLIDLSEEKDSYVLMDLLKKNENPESSTYSDDLRSINIDKYQSAYAELLTGGMATFFEHSLTESNFQSNATKETDGLKFWSLMQSYDRASNLKNLNNTSSDDSDLICRKNSPSTLPPSHSKWDEILIRFEPFPEEMVGHKIKTDRFVLC